MTIDELDLAEPALTAARLLLAGHPEVVFTSGRRSVAKQAMAMASNVAANRHWIRATYVPTPESEALQAWVDANPHAVGPVEISFGLEGVMADWSDAEKDRLSKHFSGHAFDVLPMSEGPAAEAVKGAIRALPGLTKFLEREGGLVRWHAQFA